MMWRIALPSFTQQHSQPRRRIPHKDTQGGGVPAGAASQVKLAEHLANLGIRRESGSFYKRVCKMVFVRC